MNGLPALLADGWAEVISTVVFLGVAFLIWLFQTVGKMMQQGRPQRPAGPGQQRPAPQQPGQAGLEDEIGEFLRKAAQRRQPQQQPPPPPPRQRPAEQPMRAEAAGGRQPVRADVALQRARQAADAARQRARARARQISEAAQQQAAPYAEPHRQVERSQRQPELPVEAVIAQAESASQRPELGTVFAAARPGTGTPLGNASAAGLYALLSDPGNIRQAILLAEILRRPVDRW